MLKLEYKPFHQVILERTYKAAWKEKTSSALAGTVRRDRLPLFWEAQSDFSTRKRRREGGLVHSSRGPKVLHDAIFVAALGDTWRVDLEMPGGGSGN